MTQFTARTNNNRTRESLEQIFLLESQSVKTGMANDILYFVLTRSFL